VDRVLKEVLWFATEVPRKYATRYRSVAAWDLQRKGKRVGDWVSLVAHEHVWTCASCRLRLLSAPDAKAIEAVVSALRDAFDCSPRRTPKRLRQCALKGCLRLLSAPGQSD
jgi:hypothetical protein